MPAKKPKPNEKPQFERFLETVRAVEAGETDEALRKQFDSAVTPKESHLHRNGKLDAS